MNETPIIYLIIYQCKCIRNHNMILCTLLNKTQCVSAIYAANADANMGVEADGAIVFIINVFTRDNNVAPRTMLNVRINSAVLIISLLLDCEILVAVSIGYYEIVHSNFDKSKY